MAQDTGIAGHRAFLCATCIFMSTYIAKTLLICTASTI